MHRDVHSGWGRVSRVSRLAEAGRAGGETRRAHPSEQPISITIKIVELGDGDSLREETAGQRGQECTDQRARPKDPPPLPRAGNDRWTKTASRIRAGARNQRLQIHHDRIQRRKDPRSKGTKSPESDEHDEE